MDLTKLISGAADLALFSAVRNYIYARIDLLTEQILSKNLSLALIIILSLLTIWVMIQGYMIATGRSQEGLKGFIFSLGKTYFIIMMALGVASSSSFALRTLTDTLSNGISEIMTDTNEYGSKCLTNASGSFLGCKIDQNLTVAQGIMGFINTVDTVDDPVLERQVDKAKWFAGLGSSGPGVVAGTMMIMYRIAMSLFIGFGPIFILCLMFKKTAPLFQKWLYYGLATIFSSALLGVMSDIATDLVTKVATSLFVADRLLSFVGGAGVTGIMEASTQQLGLGLILSTLLITVPPMAGMWFNGVMGQYYGSNYLGGWNGAKPPATGSGAGSGAHIQQQVVQNQQQMDVVNNNPILDNQNRNLGWIGGANTVQSTDAIKSQSVITQTPQKSQTLSSQILGGIATQGSGSSTDKTKLEKEDK